MLTKKHMTTAATLPALAKTLDRVLVRLDWVQEQQVELAKNQRKTLSNVAGLKREVVILRKTMDRLASK